MGFVDVIFAGKTFKIDAADGMDQVARQMQAGSYEPPLPFLMMATLLRTEGAFIDVGANTGLYSLLASVIASPRDIVAFEPHPLIAGAMIKNFTANNLHNKIVIHQIALSNSTGILDLYMPDQGHGLIETSASLEKDFQKVANSIKVPVEQLDKIKLPDLVAVIKVDIEGHEYAFLQGATKIVHRDRPFIFIEVLKGAKRSLMNQFLRENSYVDFRLRPDMAINDGEILFDDAAWNHAFVPKERLTKFKEACDSCGLAILRRIKVS